MSNFLRCKLRDAPRPRVEYNATRYEAGSMIADIEPFDRFKRQSGPYE